MRLSDLNSDFDTVAEAIEADLKAQGDTFKALFPGETGTLLVRMQAAVSSMMLYRIEQSLLNAFMRTAYNRSAVYALALMTGGAPLRRIGASMTIRLAVTSVRSVVITIPKYTLFSALNKSWYTLQDYVILKDNSYVDLKVYQGEWVTETFTSSGQAFQIFNIGNDFKVDAYNVVVTINGTEWSRVTDSLLTRTGELGNSYIDWVDPQGGATIIFGNNIYGNIPLANSAISISYGVTEGFGSNYASLGVEVTLASSIEALDDLEFTISSTTQASGGSNEEEIDVIKYTSPRLFASNERAVRRDDYESRLLKHSLVAAVKVWGEYEEALRVGVSDNSLMNRAYANVIPKSINQIEIDLDALTQATSEINETIPSTNPLPITKGSLEVSTIANGYLVKFTDTEGSGILTTPNFSSYGNESNPSTTSANQGNSSSSNTIDSDSSTYYDSSEIPTIDSPIRLGLALSSSTRITSFRLRAAQFSDINERAVPKIISIWGSNESTPSLDNDSNWTQIISEWVVPSLGALEWDEWHSTSSTVSYSHIMVRVTDRYGRNSYTRISEIQLLFYSDTDTSTINYVTGLYKVIYESDLPVSQVISIRYLDGSFTTAERDSILTYIKGYKNFTTELQITNSAVKLIDIDFDVYIMAGFDLEQVRTNISSSLNNLINVPLKVRVGGRLTQTELHNLIKSVSGVDYVVLTTPNYDVQARVNQFLWINKVTINPLPVGS